MWDMGNVGHDRVACVCALVSLLPCVWSVVGVSGKETDSPVDHSA